MFPIRQLFTSSIYDCFSFIDHLSPAASGTNLEQLCLDHHLSLLSGKKIIEQANLAAGIPLFLIQKNRFFMTNMPTITYHAQYAFAFKEKYEIMIFKQLLHHPILTQQKLAVQYAVSEATISRLMQSIQRYFSDFKDIHFTSSPMSFSTTKTGTIQRFILYLSLTLEEHFTNDRTVGSFEQRFIQLLTLSLKQSVPDSSIIENMDWSTENPSLPPLFASLGLPTFLQSTNTIAFYHFLQRRLNIQSTFSEHLLIISGYFFLLWTLELPLFQVYDFVRIHEQYQNPDPTNCARVLVQDMMLSFNLSLRDDCIFFFEGLFTWYFEKTGYYN